MKRVFIFVSLGAFIGAALWVASTALPSRISGVSKPVQSTMFDASGQLLPAFFEGIKPNPRFSLQRLAAESKQRDSGATCGSANRPGVLDQLFSVFVRTAQAAEDTPCSPTVCTGDYVADVSWKCYGEEYPDYPYCKGQHKEVGSGDRFGWGSRRTGPACDTQPPDGSLCAGNCAWEACDRCAPDGICENGDSAGKMAGKIDSDMRFATQNAINSTPALFINGKQARLSSAEQIRTVIRELAFIARNKP